MDYAVELKDVKKSYGDFAAVRGISLNIEKGSCFGILGPNGAGKTTLMEMMEGLSKLSSGSINILGMDITRELKHIQPRLGVQLQTNHYFQFLTVGQLLKFFVALRRASTKHLQQQNPYGVDAILDMLSLSDKINMKVSELSGGQKQRFSIAVAMLENPQIIFLDEPTSALDPQNRRYTWDFINQIKQDKSKTIVLTTHYMEEAETLCDELIIMDHGKIISQGSPKTLVQSLNKHQSIYIKTKNGQFPAEFVAAQPGVSGHTRLDNGVEIRSEQSIATIRALFDYAQDNQIEIIEFDVKLPNLEDVFINKTGAALRDE